MARTDALPKTSDPQDAEPVSRTAATAVPRRGRILLLSALAGFLLTVVWSARFVDRTIGGTITDTVLGEGAAEGPLTGVLSGIVFAFTTGLAGTFTACNIAAFGTVAPLLGTVGTRWGRVAAALKPLGWLSLGMIVVSALYGAVVGLVGTSMPQFSQGRSAPGELSGRILQAMVVYGIVGLAMLWMGLAALGYVRDPFARVSRRFPHARMVFMGALVGGFLIGRPFSLFRHLFRDAAESGNPLYGAGAFVLQSLGNIAIMSVIFLAVVYFAGHRLHAWLTGRPGRIAAFTAVTLIVAGVFLFLYWDVRLLARKDIIPWYPMAPWV
ncbi:hypothetical protein ACX6XY_13730 [Streptomyces sp. O3]